NMHLAIVALTWAFALSVPGSSLVLKDQSNKRVCTEFFYKRIEPQGFKSAKSKLKRVCQCYKGTAYFTTLYDPAKRIPVYSAYVFAREEIYERKKRHSTWYIEPQLADRKKGPNMETLENTTNGWFKKVKHSQAVNEDYKNSGFTRGHLNPNGHHNTPDSRNATFTLTNIAPQSKNANQEWAREYENKMTHLTAKCQRTYVVTGVVPSNSTLKNQVRVNIPEFFWSAFCCVGNGGNNTTPGAYLLKNKENETVVNMTLKRLERHLTKKFKREVHIFENNCT
uniref:Uncharacterized protein n=1 Tax=Latimeria chalumnae TaxID=7897 RepID=H3A7K8_LATCH